MAWVHKSAADLKAAGYIFAFSANCRSKKCRRLLFFYHTPKGGLIPVDPEKFTLHFDTCPEPQKFRRKGSNRGDASEIAASTPDVERPADPLRRLLDSPLPEIAQATLFDAGFTGKRIRRHATG